MLKQARRLALAVALAACGQAVAPPPSAPATRSAPLPPMADGQRVQSAPVVAPLAQETDAAVPIDTGDAVWGSRTAPVTIVTFSDFQCPFCSRAASTVARLQADYGPQKLRVVFKHNPLGFHPNARPAARAAAAVRFIGGSEAFWRFHDLAFANQQDLSPAKYEEWATRAGVSVTTFRAEVGAPRYEEEVARDEDEGRKLGVNGTPAFFINGISLGGAQPLANFKAIVDAELAAVAPLAEAGAAPDTLYRTRTAANYKQPAPPADDDDAPPPPDTTVWNVPVGASPTLGNASAPVTIVVFSDFQCPFCARAEPTLAEVRRQYGSKVRLVWKNEPLPFHPRALPAAMWAIEARAQKGDAAFWTAHDDLFKLSPALADADLEAMGMRLGLDLTRARAAVAASKHKAIIEADGDLAEDVEANGTPHFFINGRRLAGAQPFEKFKALIDEVLPKAEAMIAAGTKPESVYAEVIKSGRGPTAPTKIALVTPAGAPSKGPATAKVTIAEYADFQCPFCSRANPTVAEVLKAYPTQVKVEWHDLPLPFHTEAHLAAEAARAVFKLKGEAAFWKFHDALFAAQGSAGGLARPALEAEAAKLGIDMTKFNAALDAHTYAAEVDADAKRAGDAGISGTPAFVINGYLVSGAQPLRKFKRTIELALAEAGAKRR